MLNIRHRERVLSLKFSTIEACFSVPMLNLTMPNLPFLLAYVTATLGWKSWAVGLIAALPQLCNCVQPPISRALERRLSLRRIMQGGFILSAVPWLFVGFTSLLRAPASHIGFAILLSIATLANSVAAVAWSASIAEVVPPRISGAYFGRRNLIFGLWTLISVLLAAYIVDLTGNSPIIYTVVFGAAGLARLAGLFFLNKMKFPAAVTERRAETFQWSDLLQPIRDLNYRNYMLFVGLWGMFLNASLPFYTVFMLRYLEFDVGKTILLSTVATLGGIVTLRAWGTLADNYGNKPAQYACSVAWALVGAVGWFLAEPSRTAHLYLVFLVIGGATAGFQLTQFNLMLRLTPPGKGSLYVAAFLAVTSALTAMGPMLGGAFLSIMPNELAVVAGIQVLDFHLLFLLSFLGCAACVPLLAMAHEPDSKSVDLVWRRMWRMRSFNPLLAMTNALGYLLTPRGLVSLAGVSIRSLRREFNRVAMVRKHIRAERTRPLRPKAN